MIHLVVRVLGDLQILIDDLPIPSIQSDKVRALLAYLAVEAGRSHQRETLIGLLWPDCPQTAARHNLRQALFSLRLAIGDHTTNPPYLLITRNSIQFNRESGYSLDLDELNTGFAAWEKILSQGQVASPDQIAQLEEMIGLYRGDFLGKFFLEDSAEFEEWKLVQREALHRRVTDILAFLANYYERQGDYFAVRRCAIRQLELDPWREEAHCQLMRALALAGERSAALAQYETCQRRLADELGVEPSQKTRELVEQIRLGDLRPRAEPPSSVPSVPLHNLSVPLTPFIGRERELAELSQLMLDPQYRCISLVGPGGTGKTRLALQVAEQNAGAFAQGMAFIPLAPVGSMEAALPAIATAIQFSFNGPRDPMVQLLNFLREKQMLLVMDNVEHLLAASLGEASIADLILELLQKAPGIKLLVTSREALNLQGERLFEVHGLEFPATDQADRWDDYGAVALFVQRARRVHPRMRVTAEEKRDITCLCRLVEGMPLAIELAATWVNVLSPAEITAEIEHDLDFLNAQCRDLPERHRSMRAVFDRSWEMLSAEENQALSGLSVFRGGFSRQAADQVAGAKLPVLSALVTRSFVRRVATGRYDMHELVRQYAAAKLAEDPVKRQAVHDAHSKYYFGLLEDGGVRLFGKHQKQALNELTVEMNNIRAAWVWSVSCGKVIPLYRASRTLWYLFELHNWFKEGENTFGGSAGALRAASNIKEQEYLQLDVIENEMMGFSGFFQFRQGRSEEAYTTLEKSAGFLRTCSDPYVAIDSLGFLGIVAWVLGQFGEAKVNLQECRSLAQKSGNRWNEASSTEFLGVIAHDQGDFQVALQYLNEALSISRQLGDPSITAHVLSYLGRTTQMLGQYQEAEKLLQESLELAREVNYRFAVGLGLDALGQVVSAQGRWEEAQTLFTKSADLFREMGDTHRLSRTLNHQGMNSLALSQVAEARNAFRQALSLAVETGLVPSILEAVIGLIALEIRDKPCQQSLETIIFTLRHPACNEGTRRLAAALRADLETKLAQDEIEAATNQAESLTIGRIIVSSVPGKNKIDISY